MNEQRSFERFVADNVAGSGTGTPMPEDFYDDMHSFASRTRQRPQWLALIKEPPMRISSRVAVGSPTARMAAIAVATLLLAVIATGAVIGGSQLLAGSGVIVVAADGSGDYTTITEAVEVAEDGHTILVRPGTYVEAITIDKDIELTGDSEDPSQVVIEAPVDGPTFATSGPVWTVSVGQGAPKEMPYSVLLVESEASVSGLTVQGARSGIILHGGAPRLVGVTLDGVGCPDAGDAECIAGTTGVYIEAGSRATLDSNTMLGGGPIFIAESEPLIEGNTLGGGPWIWGHPSDGTVIRGNAISDASFTGLVISGPGTVAIEGNTISDIAGDGLMLGYGVADREMNAIVRDNTVSGTRVGINISGAGGRLTIEGNELSGNDTGIAVARSDAILAGNHVHGNGAGITIDLGSPSLDGNTIEDNRVGVAILSPSAGPTFSGNTICGNETNFRLMRNVEMPATDGNDICPDSVAMAGG